MPDKSSPDPDPDGWDRFTRAVDAALHTKAKHKRTAKAESKGRKKPSGGAAPS